MPQRSAACDFTASFKEKLAESCMGPALAVPTPLDDELGEEANEAHGALDELLLIGGQVDLRLDAPHLGYVNLGREHALLQEVEPRQAVVVEDLFQPLLDLGGRRQLAL